ncbi:co-chaperone GrpE [Secundilactobacillus odoratitofui DSM 19909 = JCM 15043]|uniref:Protein GrpE n=1 Tax=Secundilactobacillus odoratitofui DSM 19909 = JCM 15043 TaxID=1423776 RepID=A0A0R1M2Q7_9LACO|nr:nucleotide exchange factor GrpE [Secundilactobacillus odoratitofui]KRK98183.1 co-chaperone GrpE [Secundilactobacillus odoratitofui DSM 19909 = JCM 15043]
MAEDKTNQPASEAADEQATSATNAQSAEVTDQTSSEATDSASESATSTQTDLASALAQVADLKKQLEQASDQNLRAQAEIQNIQTRNKKDQAALIKYDGQQLAHDILPALDNLERALSMPIEGEQADSFKKGIEMVQKHLVEALTKNGVTEIKAAGEKFDPTVHQAVQSVPAESDDQKDHVTQVLQKGYQLKDRVLRPAMVMVAQ